MPITYSQRQFLVGNVNEYSAYVYHILIDLPLKTQPEHVRTSCLKFFQHFDILRARFACTSQRVWQYLDAEDSPLPWQEFEADEKGLESATRHVCGKDRIALQTQYPDAQSCLTRFVFLQGSQHDSSSRLVLRLSHAQYDGISLPSMLSTLTDFPSGSPSAAPASRYEHYIQHIFSQNPTTYEYWRGLLSGTDSPTMIPACCKRGTHEVQLLKVSRTVHSQSHE